MRALLPTNLTVPTVLALTLRDVREQSRACLDILESKVYPLRSVFILGGGQVSFQLFFHHSSSVLAMGSF